MTLEFRQGVPSGCTEWLWKNVGRGNLNKPKDGTDYDWFYERVEKEINPQPLGDATVEYISTISQGSKVGNLVCVEVVVEIFKRR
jgi:hypothetical protein